MSFVLGSQKENGRDTSSRVHCTLCQGPSLYLSSQPAAALDCCLWKCLLLAQGQLRESSSLWVGGGVIINERLIKAHCCNIPGRLSHLPNNIHHSFTQTPHILVTGRVPVVQEGLYDLQCQASPPPNTPSMTKQKALLRQYQAHTPFFSSPCLFTPASSSPKIREGSNSLQAGQTLKIILWVSTGVFKGEQPTSFLPS